MSQVEGYADLIAKLRELASPKELASAFRESVRKPMTQVRNRAQGNVAQISPGRRPWHRTYKGRIVTAGFLSRSLRLKVWLDKTKTKATAVVGVVSEAFYGTLFVELGTSKVPARPWLMPAFIASKDQAIREVGDTMKARFEKICRKRAAGNAA